MFRATIALFIVALTAGILGFSGVAAGAMTFAKITFVAFLLLAVATFLSRLVKSPS